MFDMIDPANCIVTNMPRSQNDSEIRNSTYAYFDECSENYFREDYYLSKQKIIKYQDLESKYYSTSYMRAWSKNCVPPYGLQSNGLIVEPTIINRSRNTIFVPDSYDQFIVDSGNLKSHPLSYISNEERDYKRQIYGHYHNNWTHEGKPFKAILSDKIRYICPATNKESFVLCWHQDQRNYWHFIFDAAFRLFALQNFLNDEQLTCVNLLVLGQDLNSFQKEIFEALLKRPLNYELYPRGCRIDNCWMVPTTNSSTMNFDLLNKYSSSLKKGINQYANRIDINKYKPGSRLTSKSNHIYILRGKTRNGRLITNETELIELVKKYRFTIVDPGSMTVAEQADVFENANLIVGAHGAAFANIVYMKKEQ